MTHASRDTTTGLIFEDRVRVQSSGLNISKTQLCPFLREKGISNVTDYLSWEFRPDEAYYLADTNEVVIYEKKYQEGKGSADEKLAACAWKIQEYRDAFAAIGINKVSYIYILCDWFKQKRYEKLLKYIRAVDGCDYRFEEEINGAK